MMCGRVKALLLGLVLWLLASPALAAVTVTFLGHEGTQLRGGWLYFPHAYIRVEGTLDVTGEPVNWSIGFTARNPGPQLLFMGDAGLLSEPNPGNLVEGISYAAITITDQQHAALRERVETWRAARYHLRQRNCIHFVADVAGFLEMEVPTEIGLSPNGFLKELAALNPEQAITPAPTQQAGAQP